LSSAPAVRPRAAETAANRVQRRGQRESILLDSPMGRALSTTRREMAATLGEE
jgi:hypothetical protein